MGVEIPAERPGRLAEALRNGRFAVTAEIGPPRGADVDEIRESAALLRDWVDAANITDNQGAQVRVSSFAGSVVALAEGLEPVMQMTCRDRNRIALQSDLLSAGALGIPNLVLMTGDRPERGDHADATPVFDLELEQPHDHGADAAGRGPAAVRAASSTRRRGSCSVRSTPGRRARTGSSRR